MPPAQKPVQVTPDKHFVDYEGTKIQIPRPLEEMTPNDWNRLSANPRSDLRKVSITNQSFQGLHVVLKDKNYIPIWLYTGGQRGNAAPKSMDSMERAVQMGAQLVSTLDDLDDSCQGRFAIGGADGHIHRDDVVLAKMPIVQYYALQADSIRRSRANIELQSAENKAYENVDMPHYIKGNKEHPVFEATEHSVQYQDRLRM
jgi:hypothetical protein